MDNKMTKAFFYSLYPSKLPTKKRALSVETRRAIETKLEQKQFEREWLSL